MLLVEYYSIFLCVADAVEHVKRRLKYGQKGEVLSVNEMKNY